MSYKLRHYKSRNKPIWNVIVTKEEDMISSMSIVCDNDRCVLSPVTGAICQLDDETLGYLAEKLSEYIQFGSCTIKKPTGEIKTERAISATGEDLSACLLSELKSVLKERRFE